MSLGPRSAIPAQVPQLKCKAAVSDTPASPRSIWKLFLLALALASCVCSLSYALAHVSPVEFRDFVAWPLLPGVALYAVANGSLVFGSGFGQVGSFVLIVFGSALAWASLFAVFGHVGRRWWPAAHKPHQQEMDR